MAVDRFPRPGAKGGGSGNDASASDRMCRYSGIALIGGRSKQESPSKGGIIRSQ